MVLNDIRYSLLHTGLPTDDIALVKFQISERVVCLSVRWPSNQAYSVVALLIIKQLFDKGPLVPTLCG